MSNFIMNGDFETWIPKPKKKRVGVFGGAFDPIHNGHHMIAYSLLNEHKLVDEVWFLPSYSDVFGKKNMESGEHRANMIKCSLEDRIASKNMKLCTYELSQRNSAGTYSVMKALTKAYPEIDFSFVMGSDQARSIHLWRNSRALRREFPIIVLKRAGGFFVPPRWCFSKMHRKLDDPTNNLMISSTDIRSALHTYRSDRRKAALGHFVLSGILNNKVANYILHNNLYLPIKKEGLTPHEKHSYL